MLKWGKGNAVKDFFARKYAACAGGAAGVQAWAYGKPAKPRRLSPEKPSRHCPLGLTATDLVPGPRGVAPGFYSIAPSVLIPLLLNRPC